jgi:hypothetical protein
MTDPSLLSEDERALWRSAYAAAFVAAFDRLEAEVSPYTIGATYVSRFDRAAQLVTAERASTVADLAVHRLRQWRASEQPHEGKRLRKLPDLWEQDQ